MQDLRSCVRLSEIMSQLVHFFPKIKFGRMMEDNKDFDQDTLPIIVTYKSGDLINSHVRIVDEIGYNFDIDDVIEFLESNHYLKASDAISNETND